MLSEKLAFFKEKGNIAGQRVERKSLEDSLKYLLAGWESFLEGLTLVGMYVVPDLDSIFTFEALHKPNLSVSKLLNYLIV